MESRQIGGGMLTLLNFSTYIAEHTDYKVYYVNFQNDDACKTYYNSKVNFCNLKNFNFDQFSDATFFIPYNYLLLFLSHSKNIPFAKIFLYIWHPDAVEWLRCV